MTNPAQPAGLSGVSETLLIPLYARYRDNQSGNPLLKDAKVMQIIEILQPDFSKFPASKGDLVGVAARGNIIDAAVRDFISRNNDAVIVNLGAGLCTRYDRLEQKPALWIDVDLAEIEPLWKQAFCETDQRRFLAASIIGPALWDELSRIARLPVMFIAEGVLMYLDEAEVKFVLNEISRRFSGAYLAAEVISPFFARRSQRHPSVSKTKARFRWGLDKAQDLAQWSMRPVVLNEWRLMDWQPDDPAQPVRVGFALKLLKTLPFFKNGFRVILLRLNNPEIL